MRKQIHFTTLVTSWMAMAALSQSGAKAQNVWQNFYFKADVGPAFTRDTHIREFFGPVSDVKVKFDPGVRFSAALGYNVLDWLAAEAETGVINNNIDSVTGWTRTEASLSHVPFLGNLVLQCPKQTRFIPFIGGGLGMDSAILDVRRASNGSFFLRGTDSDVVFAYQAFGGVRYAFNDQMSLGLAYKYFASGRPTYDVDDFTSGNTGRLGLGRGETHSVSVVFTLKF
jgi:opacity protein-like surface antigen